MKKGLLTWSEVQEGAGPNVTLLLCGVMNNTTTLFEPHLDSIKKRGDYYFLDYSRTFDLSAAAEQTAGFIEALTDSYEKVFLEGVSLGGKVFAAAVQKIDHTYYDRISLRLINTPLQPKNLKNAVARTGLARFIPGKVPFFQKNLDLLLREGHSSSSVDAQREYYSAALCRGEGYPMNEINDADRLTNSRINWKIFTDQVKGLSRSLADNEGRCCLEEVIVVASMYDDQIDPFGSAASASDMFRSYNWHNIVLETGHSTLLVAHDIWQKYYYRIYG